VFALYAAFARMRPPKAGDFPALALMGFPVFGASTVFLGCGRPTVPASTASLLIATIPAFTALWVVALHEEWLAAVGWAVMAVSFVGVAAISRETRAKEERPPTPDRVGAREKGARGR
jgi:drug/metabolite transporter (DMT)-like permease